MWTSTALDERGGLAPATVGWRLSHQSTAQLPCPLLERGVRVPGDHQLTQPAGLCESSKVDLRSAEAVFEEAAVGEEAVGVALGDRLQDLAELGFEQGELGE